MSERGSAQAPPFPFVVGCDRSGTTLVRALLDSHPAMAIPPEGYFAAPMLRSRADFEHGGAISVDAVVDVFHGRERWELWGLTDDDARAALVADAPRDVPSAIRSIYRAYARHAGKARYGDKTPRFVLSIDVLAAGLPESVFVHVVRDGRDVALSRRAAGWSRVSTGIEAMRWIAHVAYGHEHGRRLSPRRYLEVRYEDLVRDPESAARSLCKFLALDWEPEMLRYHERSSAILSSVTRPDLHENIAKPPTPGLRNWSTEMPAADIRTYDAVAGRTLRAFGYPVGRVGLADRLRAESTRARWRIRHGDRQLHDR